MNSRRSKRQRGETKNMENKICTCTNRCDYYRDSFSRMECKIIAEKTDNLDEVDFS